MVARPEGDAMIAALWFVLVLVLIDRYTTWEASK